MLRGGSANLRWILLYEVTKTLSFPDPYSISGGFFVKWHLEVPVSGLVARCLPACARQARETDGTKGKQTKNNPDPLRQQEEPLPAKRCFRNKGKVFLGFTV